MVKGASLTGTGDFGQFNRTRGKDAQPDIGWAKAPAVPIKDLTSGPMGTRGFAHPTGFAIQAFRRVIVLVEFPWNPYIPTEKA